MTESAPRASAMSFARTIESKSIAGAASPPASGGRPSRLINAARCMAPFNLAQALLSPWNDLSDKHRLTGLDGRQYRSRV